MIRMPLQWKRRTLAITVLLFQLCAGRTRS